MSDSTTNGNLSKGDIISFVALILMGVLVFFGMNFMTLGDRIPSIVVAIVTVVLMSVFVFLAAYAKAQNRDQSTWKKVEYSMLGLYILALIPCYFLTAKFFDVQVDKENVLKQVNKDTSELDRMFALYNRKCESRASAYQIDLEAMMTTPEGKSRIARLIDVKDPSSITKASIDQAVSSFTKSLKGGEYKALEREKNELVKNCETNFSNWNIMFIPRYAQELGTAKEKYAADLKRLYDKAHNNLEKHVPEFDTEQFLNESSILDTLKSASGFSIMGFLGVVVLGILGLVKYLFGERSYVIELKKGDASIIERGGGFTC